MIKKQNPASEAELELLNLLTEEMAECIQLISKISRFGFDSYHPQDEDKQTNKSRLESEIGDVLCIVELIIKREILDFKEIHTAIENKKDRLKLYSNVFKEQKSEDLQSELDSANAFINDAFTAHPNLDVDVERVRRYGDA